MMFNGSVTRGEGGREEERVWEREGGGREGGTLCPWI